MNAKTRTALIATATPIIMLGAAYAAVPLYRIFCEATGYGGTVQRAVQAPGAKDGQFINVRFDANSSTELGWNFRPKQTVMRVKLGEQNIAYFEAKNLGSKTQTGSAVYNVSPPTAGAFFDKIQCFCFTRQELQPGQSAEFPVTFFVDPAIAQDADGKGISEITLSYTFYPADALPQKQATN